MRTVMTEAEKRKEEVIFWKDLLDKNGIKNFLDIRKKDLGLRLKQFPELLEQTGKGLDYGCGLVSVFEFIDDKYVYACDPLLEEYHKIYKHDGKVHYMNELGQFDYICCFNVIDHTPDPQTIINDFKNHLKKGGRLYFEVHLDSEVYAPHFTLWNQAVIDKYLQDFKLIRSQIVKNEKQPKDYPQYSYQAIYIYE